MPIQIQDVRAGVFPVLQSGAEGGVGFIGTATTLIRYGGFTILTDPNFLHAGDHAHIGYGLTTTRLTDPAIEIEDLPEIDAVVLSHYHGDHFDQIVEEKLPKSTPIVTTPHAVKSLQPKGFHAMTALETWETAMLQRPEGTVRITSLPGKHGPGILDDALPPVMGSMLEFSGSAAPPLRMYISGDTLVHDELHEIPKRFPGVDLALLHLGGTRLMGIMLTMDAEQGVQTFNIVHPDYAIPVHYDDYPLFKSPLSDFTEASQAAGIQDRIVYLQRGQHCVFKLSA